MTYKTIKKQIMFMAGVSVARRQREAKNVVKSREKRKVVIGRKVRRRRMVTKKTIQKMKTRRRKKVPICSFSC